MFFLFSKTLHTSTSNISLKAVLTSIALDWEGVVSSLEATNKDLVSRNTELEQTDADKSRSGFYYLWSESQDQKSIPLHDQLD